MGKIHATLNRRRWHLCRWKAMSRDAFTCQTCGKIGGRLEVHHVVPMRDLDPKDPEAPYNLEGLMTLCRSCHLRETRKHQGTGPSDQGLSEIKSWSVFRKNLTRLRDDV